MAPSYADVKLIILEDDKEIAEDIKDNIRLRERLSAPELDYIHLSSLSELQTFLARSTDKKNWQYIVDLKLNDRRIHGGLEALKLIYSHNPLSRPFVYTAFGSKDNKDACFKIGMPQDHFYQKRILDEDMKEIGSKIANQIQYYFASKPDSSLGEVPSDTMTGKQEEQNIQPPSDVSYIKQGTIINTIETQLSIQNLVERGYEFYQLKVLEEKPDYDQLSFHQQLFACKSFLSRHHRGYNYFSVGEYLAEVVWETIEPDYEAKEFEDNQLFIQYWVDPDQGLIQGFHLLRDGEFLIRSYLPDLESVANYLKIWKQKRNELKAFERDLCEYFISQRLVELMIYGEEKTEEVVTLAQQLSADKGQTEFITNVWEWTTLQKTRNVAATNQTLSGLYDAGFDRIDDIFYCQVNQVHETDRIIEADIASVDKLDDIFPRGFDFDFLQEPGIFRPKACFKLIVYTPGKNSNSRPGRTHFVEPILQETYHNKLN